MKGKREVDIQRYLRLRERYKPWPWYVILEGPPGRFSDRRAKLLWDDWIYYLDADEGTDDFSWFRTFERAPGNISFRIHAIIGGLRNRTRIWEQRWIKTGGDARIDRFDPERDEILALLKDKQADGDLECDFELPTERNGDDAGGDSNEALPQRNKPPLTSVRVEGLDDRTTSEELRRRLELFGKIEEIAIVETRLDDDRTQVAATVSMQGSDAARKAEEEMDGFEFRGRTLSVSVLRRSER
jgi:RNA recognition motif. (a.k.a. RRM, RBD, or RNP domain)